jgi:hypothetical protein
VEAYRETFRLAGFDHNLGFVMLDELGHEMWLLFATSNVRGVEKMKDAMWAVDPMYGVRYRDPRDPDQMLLDIETVPDDAPLARMVSERLAAGPQTLDELRDWANLGTVYKQSQVLGAVRSLLKMGGVIRSSTGRLEGGTTLTLGGEPKSSNEGEQGELF